MRYEKPCATLEIMTASCCQQCVLNLLGNAFDSINEAMSKQRRVTIGIAPETPGWIAMTV